ncbi:hypothetical protein [Silvibacterium acidisoli]|uniref:hypothetical protein n=1 Tax=Acidobacteriaceae bacterium ZG23-2 TaxID=2883246 RepID=UPI00406CBDEF
MSTRILLIEDDSVLLMTRRMILREWDVHGTSSRDAIRLLQQTRFDVVILGSYLPTEAAKNIALAAKALGCEILASRTFLGDLPNLHVRLLEAPVSPDELLQCVHQISTRRAEK